MYTLSATIFMNVMDLMNTYESYCTFIRVWCVDGGDHPIHNLELDAYKEPS
jgi:hypothetical protein